MIGVGELVGGRGMTMAGHRSGNGTRTGRLDGVRVRSLITEACSACSATYGVTRMHEGQSMQGAMGGSRIR